MHFQLRRIDHIRLASASHNVGHEWTSECPARSKAGGNARI
jgi:hypothetical protein